MKVAGGQLHCVSGALQRKPHGGIPLLLGGGGGGGSRQISKFSSLNFYPFHL